MMKIVTMNQLHEDTSDVIQELDTTREPFVLTRHGRILALISPVPEGIEGQGVADWLKREGIE